MGDFTTGSGWQGLKLNVRNLQNANIKLGYIEYLKWFSPAPTSQ